MEEQIELEENMHGDYSKLSASELSALVVGKKWNRQADQEAIKRLCGNSEDMLGELLVKLVPAVISVARGRYFVDFKTLGMEDDIIGEVYLKMQTRQSWSKFRCEKRLKNWLGGQGGLVYDVVRRFVEKAKKIAKVEGAQGKDGQLESMVGTCGNGIVCRALKGASEDCSSYESPLPFSKMPTESNVNKEKAAPAQSDISEPVLDLVEFPCGSTCDNPFESMEKGELISVVKEVRNCVRVKMKKGKKNGERDWRVYYEAEDLGLEHKEIAEEFGITIGNVAKIKFTVHKRILAELDSVFRRMGVL